jgi:ribosomal protein S18 acetylase RimI-like enzyme
MAMSRLEVIPFSDEHLEDAAALLAIRHARHRRSEPLLPSRYELPKEAHDEVAAVWANEDASGAIAFREGQPVGYLIGAARNSGEWGENIWVELAGHAVTDGEDVRDLYATAAASWFDEGRRRHYAVVPAHDAALMDAWFRLGFGHQQGHGIREVPSQPDVRIPDRFEIRKPREEDIEHLVPVDLALPAHQRSSPVFSTRPSYTAEESRAEWRKTLAGGVERLLIGCLDGKPVACWSVCAAQLSQHYSGLGLPERTCYLAFASTLPEARGSGIGVALTEASLAAAAEDGYTAMVTDWRMTNLLASRFWPKRGFRPAFYRLYRSIP